MFLSLCVLYSVFLKLYGQEQLNVCPQANLSFLFISSSGNSFNSFSSFIGMQIAVERINDDDTILPDYTLGYSTIGDAMCQRKTSLSLFAKQVQLQCPGFVGIIGAGCNEATEPVAELSTFWGFPVISYASSSSSLSLREKYSNYFRLHPSEEYFLQALLTTVKYYNWTRIHVITQLESFFIENELNLKLKLNSSNISIESVHITSYETVFNKTDLFGNNMRIFFLNTYENKAKEVLCEAYKRGYFGSHYCWLLFGWYSTNWWNITSNNTSLDCTQTDLKYALEGSIIIQQYPISMDFNETAKGGLSYKSFQEIYSQRLDELPNLVETYSAHIAYDAVWLLAIALDKTVQQIKNNYTNSSTGSPTSLENLKHNKTASCLLHENLGNTSFIGLSGNIVLNENGTRKSTIIRVLQYRKGVPKLIALISNDFNYSYIDDENDTTVFPFHVPLDGTPITVIDGYAVELTVSLYILSTCGLVFCIICLTFTIIFQKRKIIRLTSPNLSYFILAGSMLILSSIFFHAHPSRDQTIWTAFCGVVIYLDSLGYALAFGTILAKMWRVYYIFRNPTAKKKTIADWHLIIFIIMTTSIMLVLLTIGYVIPQTRIDESFPIENKENFETFDENGIRVHHYVYSCLGQDSGSLSWIICIYIYVAFLQIVALILAIRTRKVQIKALNDSKEVTAIIYITSLAMLMLIVISAVLTGYNNIREASYSIGLLVIGLAIPAFIFIPNMVRLYKDPNGDKVFKETDNSSRLHVGKSGQITIVDDKTQIRILEAKILQLESIINQKTMTVSTENVNEVHVDVVAEVNPSN